VVDSGYHDPEGIAVLKLTRMMVLKLLLMVVILFSLSTCKFMGCFPVSDACEDCCKAKLKKLKMRLGSRKAWNFREPCIEECIQVAEQQGKDGYWVEKHQNCMFGY
jgi:hypothetical protein